MGDSGYVQSMKTTEGIWRFFLAASILLVSALRAPTGELDEKIYDETADGTKQVSGALSKAKKDHKRVLVQFGNNPCILCHRLHKLYETDKAIREKLKSDFVLVMIDITGEHNAAVDKKYGNPTKTGFPAVVILDEDGKQLTTNSTDDWVENNRYLPAKVLAFLKEWGKPA